MAGQRKYSGSEPLVLTELAPMAYAKVPRYILRALQCNKALAAETRILAVLLDTQYGWSGDQGRPASLTYEQIAAAVGLRKRQTIHVVAKLRARGAIEVEQSSGRVPNRYRLAGPSAGATAPVAGMGECTVSGADAAAPSTVQFSSSRTHSNGAAISAPL